MGGEAGGGYTWGEREGWEGGGRGHCGIVLLGFIVVNESNDGFVKLTSMIIVVRIEGGK